MTSYGGELFPHLVSCSGLRALLSITPTLMACHQLTHSAEVEWLIDEFGSRIWAFFVTPFFLISFKTEFDFTNLALFIVLSYAVNLMINAYSGQYIQFWGSEGNQVLYVSSVTNKGVCMSGCVCGGVWVV